MKRIPLSQNQNAIVDNKDFEKLSKFKWSAKYDKYTKSFYAVRGVVVNGKSHQVTMHSEILNSSMVDHVNHDTLDNRRENLRVCDHSKNAANCKIHKDNRSGFKGVTFERNKWRSRIGFAGKMIHLGFFETAKLAANAYNQAAKKYFGEFANLNIVNL